MPASTRPAADRLPTGVGCLDTANGGLQRGDLAVLAASDRREARLLSERIAVGVAGLGGRVAVMNADEEAKVVTTRLAGTPPGREALERRSIVVAKLSSSSTEAVLDEVGRRIGWADVIVVDPFDRVAVDRTGRINDEAAAHVTRTCKGLAKDNAAAIVLVSQLRQRGRWPLLSDLAADSLAGDADVVLLLSRRNESDPRVDVLLAKNRHARQDPATHQLYAMA